ncbi:MAG: aminotransferase class IV [Acidobacteria bacterium]|nr:aminotransferase class IV [Acidobacteriota bacterium]
MPTRININGVITAPEDAKISVLDHGLLFGDSVYETLRTYQGKPFLFSRHFARLERSAAGVDLRLPWSKSQTLEEIRRTLAPGECRIRFMVTRGIGEVVPDTETCADPSVIIIVVPLIVPPERVYEEGVDVVISSVRRSGRFADIKTGSLIHQVLARREAKLKGAFEAILLTAGEKLSDGITSNVYMVRDGKILTPSRDAGIVEGITRGVVLDLAAGMGMPIVEGFFDVGDIARAGEMFLTSSTREVVPVARVDGRPVGDGRPGPVTQRLLVAYRAAVERLIAED